MSQDLLHPTPDTFHKALGFIRHMSSYTSFWTTRAVAGIPHLHCGGSCCDSFLDTASRNDVVGVCGGTFGDCVVRGFRDALGVGSVLGDCVSVARVFDIVFGVGLGVARGAVVVFGVVSGPPRADACVPGAGTRRRRGARGTRLAGPGIDPDAGIP